MITIKQFILFILFPSMGVLLIWLIGVLIDTVGEMISEARQKKRDRIDLAARIFAEELNKIIPVLLAVKIEQPEEKRKPKTTDELMSDCIQQWETQQRLNKYSKGVKV